MIARAVACLVLVASAGIAAAQGMPDLVVSVPVLQENVHEELKSIKPNDCTLQAADLCVDGAGIRRLLRFSVLALNKGDADLVVGTPTPGDPRFVFSQCHNHYHFESFARYELRTVGGATVVKSGRKRSFCIQDLRADPDNPFARPCAVDADCAGHGLCGNGVCEYTCMYQGIQPGRGDIYESNLDCQWIDTTDVAPGSYELWVLLNTDHLLPESNFDNDSAHIGVTVGPPPGTPDPTVHVRTKKKARVGKVLKIGWKPKLKGGNAGLSGFDVWLARDGSTFSELLATGTGDRKLRWTVTGDPSDHAVVKVVAWTKALAQGFGTSHPFRIVP